VERCDACKSTPIKSPPKPGLADAAEHWNVSKSSSGNKNKSSSTGRASSRERWDMNKKSPASFSSSSSLSSSPTSRAAATSSCRKWGRTKRPVSHGSSSSAKRWDAHKKPRPWKADGQSSTRSNDMEVDDEPSRIWGPTLHRASSPSPHRSQQCFPYYRCPVS
jgi:hypothetical protein